MFLLNGESKKLLFLAKLRQATGFPDYLEIRTAYAGESERTNFVSNFPLFSLAFTCNL